jgi:hypothetical protein
MENPIEEWLVSTAQRPGDKGSERLAGVLVMAESSAPVHGSEKAGLILVLAGPE